MGTKISIQAKYTNALKYLANMAALVDTEVQKCTT